MGGGHHWPSPLMTHCTLGGLWLPFDENLQLPTATQQTKAWLPSYLCLFSPVDRVRWRMNSCRLQFSKPTSSWLSSSSSSSSLSLSLLAVCSWMHSPANESRPVSAGQYSVYVLYVWFVFRMSKINSLSVLFFPHYVMIQSKDDSVFELLLFLEARQRCSKVGKWHILSKFDFVTHINRRLFVVFFLQFYKRCSIR